MLMMFYSTPLFTHKWTTKGYKRICTPLEEWAANWRILFNSQKCEFLRVTNKKHPILAQYSIQKETIREVTHAKYLGVTIDWHFSWSEHIKQITNKANK